MTEQVNKPKRTRKVATPEPELMAVVPEELAMEKGEWNKIGDKQPQSLPSLVTAVPMDVVATEAELKVQENEINKYNISGKRQGVVVYVKDKACLYAATGMQTKDAWVPQKASGTAVTMGANIAALATKIGDVRRRSKPVAIPATSLPLVTAEDLGKQNHPVNIHALSGKKLGSCVFDSTNNCIMVAQGSKPEDKWVSVLGTAKDATPTGEAFVKSVGKFTGESARKAYQPVVTCVDFPVYKVTEELSKKGHIINIAKMSGKREGAIVIGVTAAGAADLYIAAGSKDVDTWTPQSTGTAITPAA